MTQGTHTQRIVSLLARMPGLDDDEIARALAIEARQTVNKICRILAGCGVLWRERGPGGKIVNRLAVANETPVRPRAKEDSRLAPAEKEHSGAGMSPEHSLLPADPSRTLLIISCSKAKQDRVGIGEDGPSIMLSLPSALAREFREARQRVKEKTPVDETILIPAWRRYDGSLYRTGHEALANFVQAGAHMIILSGGYGAVLASEPIGLYNAVLRPSWWPHNILERVLIAYVKHHRLASVRALASATSAYRSILQQVRWHEAGIKDALLLTPQAGTGGTRKSPASQGEALAALRDGTLTMNWQSSYGLRLDVEAA